MVIQTAEPLTSRKCRCCEGGMQKYSRQEAEAELQMVSGWHIADDGLRIEKHWQVKDFLAGIEFFIAWPIWRNRKVTIRNCT